MADRGVDVGTIGLVSLASLPYTIKFLWAPIVDALPVPWLSARLGRRRGWLVASQLALMGTILFLGTRDPVSAPLMVGLGALLVAFTSATQDIVIDAYRVESLSVNEQAAGMAGYVAALVKKDSRCGHKRIMLLTDELITTTHGCRHAVERSHRTTDEAARPPRPCDCDGGRQHGESSATP